MQFFEDTIAAQSLIEEMIRKYGYASEHNFWYYQYYQDYYNPPHRNIFATTDYGALLGTYDEHAKEYFVVFDPLALSKDRIRLVNEYIEWIFSNTPVKKVWFQLDQSNRKEFLRTAAYPPHLCRIYYTLTCPIMNLEKFDTELPGGHYKTLRKEMHKFYREHQVVLCDARTYEDKKGLHDIVDDWKKKRPNNERGMTGVYHKMIDGSFEGMDEARVFVVDGKASGFNAGWKIPNIDRFYAAVGIHNYSVDDLGTMLYLEDLLWLKNKGYREADMGGGEKSLTAFKNKFLPESSYKLHLFSVKRPE